MRLVKFKQDNCTPCKMLEDTLNDLGVHVDEEINLSTTTKDEDRMLAGMLGIEKTPTLVLMDGDEPIDRHKGVGITGIKRLLTKRGLI